MQIAIKTPRPEARRSVHAPRAATEARVRARALFRIRASCACSTCTTMQGRRFMTMELVEGKLLSTCCATGRCCHRRWRARFCAECAEALTHAHSRDVVHGDFKPGNVFITPTKEVKHRRLRRGCGPDALTISHRRRNADVREPEVLSGETPEPRDDVFSFACVAYELLTGQHPFERRSSLQARDEGRFRRAHGTYRLRSGSLFFRRCRGNVSSVQPVSGAVRQR